MNRIRLLGVLLLTVIFNVHSYGTERMSVSLKNDTLIIIADFEEKHTIQYEFTYCMANKLYTFNRVWVDSTLVNHAVSDNIGPFLIRNRGWMGGNHLSSDGKNRTAYTAYYKIFANDNLLTADTAFSANKVDIKVTNHLLDPKDCSTLFCIENIHYKVSVNSIQVEAKHMFVNPDNFIVDRYYGMQSVNIGESEILTPHGMYKTWTPIKDVDRFKLNEAPDFRQFIEKSKLCYMAAYLFETGLGNRKMMGADDFVFIGNSYTKSYHRLIAGKTLGFGDITSWKGVYTWFVNPRVDIINRFEYVGYLDGNKTIFVSEEGYKDKFLKIK